MFLKELTINSASGEIRKVTFKKGLNLVVDVTGKTSTSTGNDVGKTTLLRVIDYCLGSSGESLYKDTEFKNKNEEFLGFLKEKRISFTLVLESANGATHKIYRPFEGKPQIDTMEYSEDGTEFRAKLGRLLFGLNNRKPTFRQAIKKFVRIENFEIENTIKYLHTSTPWSEYEAVYLYLFGFQDQEVLSKRNDLQKELKKLAARKKSLKDISEQTIKQILAVLDRDITDLETKRDEFDIQPGFEKEISNLEAIRKNISNTSNQLANLQVRLNMNNASVSRLKTHRDAVDTRKIAVLYEEAKSYLPTLQKKLEEVVAFHEAMINNKVEFIENAVIKIQLQIEKKQQELAAFAKSETALLKEISKKGALEDLRKLEKQLNEKFEERGKKAALLAAVKEVDSEIKDFKKNLNELNERISASENDLSKKFEKFNEFFADVSKKLYNEEYIFSFEKDEGKDGNVSYSFPINNLRGNSGAGKKKAQTTAFDLAYLQFLDFQKANMPRFILHDHLEEVHINQLETLFNIANGINGQYIVAILRDKIETLSENVLKENTILNLSQDDKLFKFK